MQHIEEDQGGYSTCQKGNNQFHSVDGHLKVSWAIGLSAVFLGIVLQLEQDKNTAICMVF
jgi:hypothetical protein